MGQNTRIQTTIENYIAMNDKKSVIETRTWRDQQHVKWTSKWPSELSLINSVKSMNDMEFPTQTLWMYKKPSFILQD